MSKFISGAAFRTGSRKRNLKFSVPKGDEVTQDTGFRDDDCPAVSIQTLQPSEIERGDLKPYRVDVPTII